MNREKSTGKKTTFYAKLTLIALVLFSITLSACPPLEEDPFSNTIIVTGDLDQAKWMEILIEIHERGMPVNLDLSAMTVPEYGADILKRTYEDGTEYEASKPNVYNDYIQFDPLPGFPYGKELIKTLILPKAATMIRNAKDISITLIDEDEDKKESAFRHFTNLRSITGENIRLIGTLAFIDCKPLEEANFKRAVHIMQYAFSGCTGLKKVEFEVARDIHISAFENCTNLEKVILPYAGVVSQRAFKNCRRLTEVNFDVATRVGDEAFRDCISLRYARFRANPERDLLNAGIHPLQQWIDDNDSPRIFDKDSIVFYNNAFRGCKSLEVLDVRYAWNVYFSAGALADIGENLELFLFDDNGTKSYGHPQIDMFLGDIEESEENGGVTLKTITIKAPVVPPDNSDSRIMFESLTPGMPGIRNFINSAYNGDDPDDRDENNEPLNPLVKVTVQRGPALQ